LDTSRDKRATRNNNEGSLKNHRRDNERVTQKDKKGNI